MRPSEQVHAMLERFRKVGADPTVFDTLLWVTHPDLPDTQILSYITPLEAPSNTPILDQVKKLFDG